MANSLVFLKSLGIPTSSNIDSKLIAATQKKIIKKGETVRQHTDNEFKNTFFDKSLKLIDKENYSTNLTVKKSHFDACVCILNNIYHPSYIIPNSKLIFPKLSNSPDFDIQEITVKEYGDLSSFQRDAKAFSLPSEVWSYLLTKTSQKGLKDYFEFDSNITDYEYVKYAAGITKNSIDGKVSERNASLFEIVEFIDFVLQENNNFGNQWLTLTNKAAQFKISGKFYVPLDSAFKVVLTYINEYIEYFTFKKIIDIKISEPINPRNLDPTDYSSGSKETRTFIKNIIQTASNIEDKSLVYTFVHSLISILRNSIIEFLSFDENILKSTLGINKDELILSKKDYEGKLWNIIQHRRLCSRTKITICNNAIKGIIESLSDESKNDIASINSLINKGLGTIPLIKESLMVLNMANLKYSSSFNHKTLTQAKNLSEYYDLFIKKNADGLFYLAENNIISTLSQGEINDLLQEEIKSN